MDLRDLYKKYDGEIWTVGIMMIVLVSGMAISYGAGYDDGMSHVQRPEYRIQVYSMDVNYTVYNDTYYMLTRKDMSSSKWVIDTEQRDDYFVIGVSIEAESANWSRFFLSVERVELTNITIELISITAYYSDDWSWTYNFYDGAYGGTLCKNRAIVYFLGYGGVVTDIGSMLSASIGIRGYFG